MRKRVLVWPAALLFVSFAAYASATGPTSCPGIGLGGPDLEVGVRQFAAAHQQNVRVTLCVANQCSPAAEIGPQSVVSTVVGRVITTAHPVEMSLTAIDVSSGRTLLTLLKTITYTHLEPYGKGCGFQDRSYHTLTARGSLIAATPTAEPK
jgi:hypothetical protein